MKTAAVCFPFDLFGSPGSAAGAQLLADELREVLADNRRESVPTRARAYTPHVRLRETSFATLEALSDWRAHGRRLVRQALRQGDFLLWLAGNHLGALPCYDELSALGETILVVQLDAHLDIHHFRDCADDLTHGNFLLHCAGPLPPLVNVGHRDLLLPADHVRRAYRATYSAADLATDAPRVLAELRQRAAAAEQVFLDLDCDVLDPAVFPAVGQPVPFGLAPPALLAVIEAVCSPRLRGVFVSEFCPARDRADSCLATLVWLLEYLLLRHYE